MLKRWNQEAAFVLNLIGKSVRSLWSSLALTGSSNASPDVSCNNWIKSSFFGNLFEFHLLFHIFADHFFSKVTFPNWGEIWSFDYQKKNFQKVYSNFFIFTDFDLTLKALSSSNAFHQLATKQHCCCCDHLPLTNCKPLKSAAPIPHKEFHFCHLASEPADPIVHLFCVHPKLSDMPA